MNDLKEITLLTVPEAADIKGCTRQNIYYMIRNQELNVKKTKGRMLVRNDDRFKNHVVGRIKHHDIPDRVDELESLLKSWEAILSQVCIELDSVKKEIDQLNSKLQNLEE